MKSCDKMVISNREEWIDNAKGLAIFLVVFEHVVRGFISANMFKSYYDVFSYLDFTIYSFHMPLFFILSGYLYEKVEGISSFLEYKKLVLKKLIKLGVPYVVFSILQGLTNVLLSSITNTPMSISTVLNIPFYPLAQFWFLYTLIAIFIIIPIMDISIKNNLIILFILLALKLYLPYAKCSISFLSFFMSWSFYFYLGKMIFLYLKNKVLKKDALIICSAGYIFLNLYFFKINGKLINTFGDNISSIALGVCGSAFAVLIIIASIRINAYSRKAFNFLGVYSFSIYLLHIFFGSGTRIVLSKILGINNFIVHITLGMGAAIFVPVLLAYLWHKATDAWNML